MYQVGDLIIYGNHGVCKVEAVGTLDIPGVDDGKIYYTLRLLYQECKIFIPINTSVFMRPVITYEEAQQLISIIPSIKEDVDNNIDPRLWKDYYKESLQTHDCIDLLKIIKTIYTKNTIAEEQGRKLGQTDERYMKKAEDLLYGEFAVALGIPKENVRSYIENKINEIESRTAISSGGEIYEHC